MKVNHEHPVKKREDRSCSDCIHAHKIDDEYDKMYECDAKEYDIEHLTCFIPKEGDPQ